MRLKILVIVLVMLAGTAWGEDYTNGIVTDRKFCYSNGECFDYVKGKIVQQTFVFTKEERDRIDVLEKRVKALEGCGCVKTESGKPYGTIEFH